MNECVYSRKLRGGGVGECIKDTILLLDTLVPLEVYSRVIFYLFKAASAAKSIQSSHIQILGFVFLRLRQ